MPKLRRKRTWLLVLLGVAIVSAAGVWWLATDKSDVKERFDKLRVGMDSQEVAAILWVGPSDDWIPSSRINYHSGEGESFTLVFDDYHRLIAMKFEPIPISERLRRLWGRCFRPKPPMR